MLQKKFPLPKSSRLRKRGQFVEVTRRGQQQVGCFLIIRYFFKEGVETKLGITASRKYGKAHQRNRIKRLLREAYRLERAKLPSNLQINVIPKHRAHKVSLKDLQDELLTIEPTCSRI